ncbi:class I SAM-dependent methyltransferase [Halorussus caseinilyticus]|nr:class I SAM-dependent methyltransferase [Halorussus sp. DT72]
MSNRFEFGENWESYLDQLTDEQVAQAERELRDVFDRDSLDGQSVVDIGCGSGLFSLAAHRLGASEIVSFDYDEDSVTCCRRLRDETDADDWTVERGDILDSEFVAGLGEFDAVYCWGVVHHTGEMWRAIDHTTRLLADDGRLCLGIYNKVERGESLYNSFVARRIKRAFNRMPRPVQKLLVFGYGGAHLTARTLLKRESPLAYLDSYRQNRGMDYWHDVRDWLGGYPFEFATPSEVQEYVATHHPSLEHVRTDAPKNYPETVNTYVFQH